MRQSRSAPPARTPDEQDRSAKRVLPAFSFPKAGSTALLETPPRRGQWTEAQTPPDSASRLEYPASRRPERRRESPNASIPDHQDLQGERRSSSKGAVPSRDRAREIEDLPEIRTGTCGATTRSPSETQRRTSLAEIWRNRPMAIT